MSFPLSQVIKKRPKFTTYISLDYRQGGEYLGLVALVLCFTLEFYCLMFATPVKPAELSHKIYDSYKKKIK